MSTTATTVLITGANGFVGARLCRRFLKDGWKVVAGVRKTSNLDNLDGQTVEYRYGDVCDTDTLPSMVAGADVIVHNAGVVKARRARTFYEVNEKGTENLLKAVTQHNPDLSRFVYISSLAAAGPSRRGQPRTEDDPPAPVTEYGRSKLAGERAVLAYADELPVVVVRPPGIYGPGDKEIFTFFQAVHRHLRPAIGDQSRLLQLVHVDDLAEGVCLAATRPVSAGRAYFVAEDRAYSMHELTGLLIEAIGRRTVPVYLPAGLFRLVAAISETVCRLYGGTPMLTREKAAELLADWEVSIERAGTELGYRPRIPFARGAVETYQWYRKQGWL
jgi:nucleoside-diphosphate-sugar epimerase